MHTVVHNYEPACGTSVFCIAEPRVDQHRDVMIPVQEDQRLFAQHYEYRIAQFGQFAQHKEPGPETAHAILFNVATGERERECGDGGRKEQNEIVQNQVLLLLALTL